MEIKKTIRLLINDHADREKIVVGLANSGYFVRVVREEIPNNYSSNYFVCIKGITTKDIPTES
jgi:hypothetical protein